MSKASEIIVLCEDKAHEVFVVRFLKRKWKGRNIRVRPYPKVKGSAKQYVQESIGDEIEVLRQRQAITVLVIVQDVDELSVEQAKAILDNRISPPRKSDEPIVYVLPKWHIETWIAYLHNEFVDESDKSTYKCKYKKICESKQVHGFVDALADQCRENRPLKSPPPSLVETCKEFNRIRKLL